MLWFLNFTLRDGLSYMAVNVLVVVEESDWGMSLSKCDRYDFYHTWDYHHVACLNGEGKPVLFDVNMDGRGFIFPLLARSIEGSLKKDLTSVYGYPGPLLYGDMDEAYFNEMWTCFSRFLVEADYVSLFSRCHPLYLSDYVKKHTLFSGKVVVIDLYFPEVDQLGFYRSNHNRDIKKLNGLGVVCHFVNDMNDVSDEFYLSKFMENYNATMTQLNASVFYFFSREYYLKLMRSDEFETRLYSCEYNGEVICSGMFVFCKDMVQYHLGGTHPDFYRLAPTKKMFDTVRKDAADLGYKFLCLGGGVGSKEDSLFNFKSGFSKHVEEFNLIKVILDEREYRSLSCCIDDDGSFFPLYRKTI